MAEMSPASGVRRFNLGDLMILTIAAAVAFQPAAQVVSHIADSFARIPPAGRSIRHLDDLAWWWDGVARGLGPRSWVASGIAQLLLCLLTPLAPALLVARLRRPRPTLRMLSFQPGFIACVLICLSLLTGVELTILRVGPIPPETLMAAPGALVGLAWSILAATRCWRAESSWVDRGGRIVGAAWIALLPWLFWSPS